MGTPAKHHLLFLGKKLTNCRTSEVSVQIKENIEEKRTLKNEKVEVHQEKVSIQRKESIEKKLTPKTEKVEVHLEKVFHSEHYNHLLCEHGRGKFTTLMLFLDGREKFKYVDVPGKENKIKCTQGFLRRLLIGLLVRFQHLHSEGKTLNGCFLAENICVPLYEQDQNVPGPYIEVKFDTLQPDSFMPYTEEGGGKDLVKLGWILDNQVLSSEMVLPSDLKQLVNLLRGTPIKDKDLIYGHVSLMGGREQVSHFLWLYKRLLYLKKKMPSKYKNIMEKISSVANGWSTKAKKNKFLAKLKPSRRYSGVGEGLTRFYRNSVEHLFKMFKDLGSTFDEEELEDYHIIYILTEAFPELLCDLQKSFHEEGEFQALRVEDSSRECCLLAR